MQKPLRTLVAAAGLIGLSAHFNQAAGQDVFARPDLLAEYPVAAPHLAEWADMPVVLMTMSDLDPAVVARARAMGADYQNWLRDKSLPLTEAETAVKDRYIKEAETLSSSEGAKTFRDAFRKLTGSDFNGDAARAFDGMFVSEAHMNPDQTDTNGKKYCLIRLFDKGWDNTHRLTTYLARSEEHAAALAGALGTVDDWRTFVLAHEAGHCRTVGERDPRQKKTEWNEKLVLFDAYNRYYAHTLSYEIDADRFALEQLEKLSASGAPLTPGIGDLVTAVRALGAINVNGRRGMFIPEQFSHATAPALHDHHHGATPADTTTLSSMTGMLASLNYVSATYSLLIARVMAPPVNDYVIHTPLTDCRDVEVFNRCQTTTFETTGRLVDRQYYDARRYGHAMGLANPALRVAAVQALSDSGIFRHDKTAQAYADQYLQAVRTVAPGLADPALLARFRSAFVADPGLKNRLHESAPYAVTAIAPCPNGYPSPTAKAGDACHP